MQLVMGILIGLIIVPLIKTIQYHRYLRKEQTLDILSKERRQMMLREE